MKAQSWLKYDKSKDACFFQANAFSPYVIVSCQSGEMWKACFISCRSGLAKTITSMHFQLVNFGDKVAKLAIMLAQIEGSWYQKSPNWRGIASIGWPVHTRRALPVDLTYSLSCSQSGPGVPASLVYAQGTLKGLSGHSKTGLADARLGCRKMRISWCLRVAMVASRSGMSQPHQMSTHSGASKSTVER